MWFYGALELLRSFSARTKFSQEFTDVFYSLFISSSALHLIAERLASVTADTSFNVFGLTRLRIEPSLPASKANALIPILIAVQTSILITSLLVCPRLSDGSKTEIACLARETSASIDDLFFSLSYIFQTHELLVGIVFILSKIRLS